jgi:hypothetical protein
MEQNQEHSKNPWRDGARTWATVPSRPFLLSAVNAVGRGLGRLGFDGASLDPEVLAGVAQRHTRLNDYGHDLLWAGLDRLTRSLDQEARLTPTGRLMARREILRLLTNHLRIENEVTCHPEIEQETIPEPIFILGLPRTGTTLLQRLLGQDPANRVLETWQMRRPVPSPRQEMLARNGRILNTSLEVGFANYAMPRLKRIHEVGARLPDECLFLMANDFVSYWFVAVVHVPGYRKWLHEQDLSLPYGSHRRQLQLLQSTVGRRRWVLKTPFHLHGLPWLLSVYPDARIIQTKRDPVAVLPSFASLLVCLRSAFCDGIDPKAVGIELTEDLPKWFAQAAAARAIAERSMAPRPIFCDVEYHALVADPIGTVERIYEAFGMQLSNIARQRMHAFIQSNPQHKHGVHRYSLEEFGIDYHEARAFFA